MNNDSLGEFEIINSKNSLKDTSEDKILANSKLQFTINAQSDLLSIPISTFLQNNNKIEFKGSYYKYLVNEVITRLEKKNIKEVKLTQKIFKPEVKSIQFRITANTLFGENVKITGSTSYLGNWKDFEDLTYQNGAWVFEINENSKDSPLLNFNFSESSSSFSSTSKKDRDSKTSKEIYFGSDANNRKPSNYSKDRYNEVQKLEFEYKFVIKGESHVQWEQTPNRRFNLKELKEQIEYYVFSTVENTSGTDNGKKVNNNNTCINLINLSNEKAKCDYLKINSHSDKVINSNSIIGCSSRTINSNNAFSIEKGKECTDISVKIELTPNCSLEYHSKIKLLVLNMKFDSL